MGGGGLGGGWVMKLFWLWFSLGERLESLAAIGNLYNAGKSHKAQIISERKEPEYFKGRDFHIEKFRK